MKTKINTFMNPNRVPKSDLVHYSAVYMLVN